MERRDPAKWAKFRLLGSMGLTDPRLIESEVRRYQSEEWERMMVEIRRDMSGVVERGELYLYVVKLVPQLATRQLPNFRMRCAADVDRVSATLRAMSLGSFAEVWWCRTRVDRSVTSVGGRLRLGTGDVCLEQVIEQVWFESPRVLETRADDILVPRFRGTRPSWGWRWRARWDDLRGKATARHPGGHDGTRTVEGSSP